MAACCLLFLIGLTIAWSAEAHRGGWASHSTLQAGGPPDARSQTKCRSHRCRHKVYWDRKYQRLADADKGWLFRLRICESGNGRDEHGGPHHGRYQYLLSTAWSAGYTLDPHRVYPHEDDVRTIRWRNRAGSSQWPNCAPW